MGKRPDELRPDPHGESRRETDPLADPAAVPEGVSTPVGPDPALGGGVCGGGPIDEEEGDRIEIERPRTQNERTKAGKSGNRGANQGEHLPGKHKKQAKKQGKET